jgi:hypothetical protein
LASCPACRIEAESLARLTTRIPVSHPQLDRDLLPQLRRRLEEDKPYSPKLVWRVAFAAAVATVLVVAGISVLYTYKPIPNAGQSQVAEASPVEHSIERANALMSARDYVAAYRLLGETVATHPNDASAGQAQRLHADIAFAQLQWYPEAHEDYEGLAKNYPALFRTNPDNCITRRDLLAEARVDDYAPLYALDAARRASGDKFAQLEKVVTRYQKALFVTALAAEEMARVVARELPAADGQNQHVAAMECARDRCTDPAATARLNLEIGHIYLRELNEPEKARNLYDEVANSANATLADLARESLAELEPAISH